MIFTFNKKTQDTKQYHKWFAWYPVRIVDVYDPLVDKYAWLETVYRKEIPSMSIHGSQWLYTLRLSNNE